ncbi:hypothetical protein BTH_I1616 [Burkholderia thailandensis E264]|uniref:Uncharacterized protein n=1 Tax=Burkholderia thailandensis (strain ATCC 700388 / DSM 13276 / CCUG 48851 / CIP 106301 / E264) TaxID=271848 RepID=Q2SY45_BURTA|nr:hypothetical protein BTH_I1616 [Burkholderia thailandensis E264]AOJ46020.1 hypothetical protein WJ27_13560 [Burkholderia thailandensis]KVG05715.1 hypothetical protein WJ25_18565 [Burkholderia thailandensis]KVG20490.1 hypothetical protein WJ28_27105 [Burkholderia thailandensis]
MLTAVLDIAPGCRFVRGRSRARPAGAAPRDAEDETAATMRSRGAHCRAAAIARPPHFDSYVESCASLRDCNVYRREFATVLQQY